MKKTIFTLLLALLLLSVQTISAFAETSDISVTYLPNGDYFVTIIEDVDTSHVLLSARTTTTKSKTTYYKNSNNQTLWYVKVTGSFTYDGTTAKCTSVTPSAVSSDSAWKVSNISGSKSGNKATASATGKQYLNNNVIQTINKTVTLTCSPTGVFS